MVDIIKTVAPINLADKIDSLEKLMAYVELMRPVGHVGPVLNAVAVERLTGTLGPLDDENFWKWREHMRMVSSGAHLSCNKSVVLGGFEFEPLHYLHVSREDKEKVAYTVDADKGRRDLQTRISIGRYLRKMFPAKTDDEIRLAAAEYSTKYVPPTLLYALAQDEIEKVYESAPFGSCMRRKNGHLKTAIHPVRAYASGDFAVAYYVNAAGEIGARAVVTLKEEGAPSAGGEYVRIFGDTDRMEALLEDAGFSHCSGAYLGKRLLKITDPNNGRYIAPYLDGDYSQVDSCGDFWEITENGELDASEASGYPSGADEDEDMTSCGHCGDTVHIDNTSYSDYHNMTICSGCIDTDFVESLVRRDRTDWVERRFAFYFEGGDEYYVFSDHFSPEDVGLVFDGNSDLQREGDCVWVESEARFFLDDECTDVGNNGEVVYELDSTIERNKRDFWFKVSTKEVRCEEDDELAEWLAEEEDERDNTLYVNYEEHCNEIERKKRESKAAVLVKLPLSMHEFERPLPAGTVLRLEDGNEVTVSSDGPNGSDEVPRVYTLTGVQTIQQCLSNPHPLVVRWTGLCPVLKEVNEEVKQPEVV